MKVEERVCCFVSGAADIKENDLKYSTEKVRGQIEHLIEKENILHFICGMTISELPAAVVVLEMKKKYPHITLECVLPYEEQAAYWKSSVREIYFNILAESDSVITLQARYDRKCISKQRKYIHAKSQCAIFLDSGLSLKSEDTEKQLTEYGIVCYRAEICQTKKETVS